MRFQQAIRLKICHGLSDHGPAYGELLTKLRLRRKLMPHFELSTYNLISQLCDNPTHKSAASTAIRFNDFHHALGPDR